MWPEWVKEVCQPSSSQTPQLDWRSVRCCGCGPPRLSPNLVDPGCSGEARRTFVSIFCFQDDFINWSSFPSTQGKNSKKSHSFPPMNRDHRRIIHDLAQVYGLESVSYDSEPKRNVVVTAVRWADPALAGGPAGGPGPGKQSLSAFAFLSSSPGPIDGRSASGTTILR